MRVDFTIGAEADDAVPVTVRLKQDRFLDRNVGSKRVVGLYVSTDAAGLTPVDLGGDDTLVSIGEVGALLLGADAASEEIGEARAVTGPGARLDVVLTNGSDETKTRYLNVVTPDGKVHTSAAIAFVDDTP